VPSFYSHQQNMKPLPKTFVVILLSLSAFTVYFSPLFGQGSLTPPGAPAPTMKTLNQIEARVPLSAAATISAPGSYYLTQTITVATGNAITINASNVTLDLNGYTISSSESPAGSGNAIFINAGFSNITILNGHINSGVSYSGGNYSGTGFGNGINYGGSGPNNVRVRGVNVYGVLSHGIYLGFSGTTVEGCTVVTAGHYGIYANSVSNSTSLNTGSSGILAQNALNCTGTSNSSHGVQATAAMNCQGTAAGAGHGVSANTASNCYGTAANGDGVNTFTAIGCQGTSTGSGYGINANVASDCNGTSDLGTGVRAAYTARNCYGNVTGGLTGPGIITKVATNCYGLGTGGAGIVADDATGCEGFSAGGPGIIADVVTGCRGQSQGGNGITATYIAINSLGISSFANGLQTTNATNCYGQTAQHDFLGILANTANSCRAWQTSGGPPNIAISADIAIGCTAAAGTISSPSKWLGTP
jgi:hypothetical protein